ncbi:hypothetical protein [Bacillus cereus]|uniref:Uncharacterized protein n=1 Tax=Bacillus cereus TaxID=1396 RepID=A0AAW5KUY8_BACCE|nr:hypothetical protein [Bacillus cereus]MCQ6284867.1 hypothetical protein [Bacillus cereus]MCQ6314412.1 hypothetical protein [Bacillus cereus]MCQ6326838.1 hypothetical protein [Bacillus cereus]MCQ6380970.1 hypothetical protein [Bacillus cereus]
MAHWQGQTLVSGVQEAIGTRHYKFFAGSISKTFTYNVLLHGIYILNEGASDLTLTIHNESTTLKPGQGYQGVMEPFTKFSVDGTSSYKGEVLM